MRLLFLQLVFTLMVILGEVLGYFFSPASIGGQTQGERHWQDFEKYENNYEERYPYENPGYHQQYVDYQHQYHPQNGEMQMLRPTQTLIQATQHLLQQSPGAAAASQHLLQPAAQQLLQPAQHLYQSLQHYHQPHPSAYNDGEQNYHPLHHQHIPRPQSPLNILPTYQQLVNRFQQSAPSLPTPQNAIPVVVRLVENQAAILPPVRAVYALPPFLEKLVQKVQGYYSVYNAPEQLTLDRPLFRPTVEPSIPPATEITLTEEISDIDNANVQGISNNEITTAGGLTSTLAPLILPTAVSTNDAITSNINSLAEKIQPTSTEETPSGDTTTATTTTTTTKPKPSDQKEQEATTAELQSSTSAETTITNKISPSSEVTTTRTTAGLDEETTVLIQRIDQTTTTTTEAAPEAEASTDQQPEETTDSSNTVSSDITNTTDSE